MKEKLSKEMPIIPYDIYESPQELVLFLPLGGVRKESIHLSIKNYRLVIAWERIQPMIKETLLPLKESCYRGPIHQEIDLPPQVYFDKIHSKLSPDNILQVIIPKALIPERIELEVEYDSK
jgi:HSP20 family molecular chaperone IbpA